MFNPRHIRDIIKSRHLSIRKALGQNFLIDKNIRDMMVRSCAIKKDDILIEIGPGMGALTEAVAPTCKKIVAVEKDKGLAAFLSERFGAKGSLNVVNKDILEFDLASFAERCGKKLKVIGNLPFYITSPIIFYLLENKRYIDSIFITVQKEVARRIASGARGKDYGLLSCSVQYHAIARLLLRIPGSCFFPAPGVNSSFLELRIRKAPQVKVEDEALFFNVVRSAFGQRRKTLFNSLNNSPLIEIGKPGLSLIFERLKLDRRIRGEGLGLDKFAELAKEMGKL